MKNDRVNIYSAIQQLKNRITEARCNLENKDNVHFLWYSIIIGMHCVSVKSFGVHYVSCFLPCGGVVTMLDSELVQLQLKKMRHNDKVRGY